MIYTMLKSCFNNTEPKLLNCRVFNNFSQEAFKKDLSEALCFVVTHMMILITFLYQN